MSKQQLQTNTEEETLKVAEKLATLVNPGDVITLEGDLGAGKTTFTKGLATGLGVKRTVNSPTFTIVKEYEGNMPLYHMDVYRLENSEEDIGFEEYFSGDGLTVVEWAQFIEEFLPEDILNITITYVDKHSRLIEFEPKGKHYEEILTELLG
ncbi:tRNA (adenosine(37)-N6)-threonylcarbamoyltransferase complex ATPase subunit type 1 TsaE [Ornithinibacillus salinisoli]|uniref:tRNA threonylcarbamoyladenosine biosynthesis protein TsaE n=1 Tax=Ornithinibacillus salinisoli TaxID=1848459 RepID=A0ABW4W6Q6_9BACI